MRFNKIEMTGFKSFVDKTTVSLPDGVTAVVGPNGCGKSNISDAIRWVLGEKSAKNMRGDKMEDVIFNGTESRMPTGMAEVSMTLENVEGGGPLGFTEFKDVTITRRLFRSGDSEYLINKIPCRLKDIKDLLMDTGIGSKAYSIIEQGKIGQIVQAKAEERRFIIEEVAGITRYKTRKNEALSKLKETAGNLDRVNDILHEVKRQMNSLDRQAKKAERYKKLTAELRTLELKLSWEENLELRDSLARAESEVERAFEAHAAAKNSVSAREADLSEARIKLAESERALVEFQRGIHELESEVSHTEVRAELAADQLVDMDEREERMLMEHKRLVKEDEELNEHASSLAKEHESLKAELDALQNELRLLGESFQAKATRVNETESSIDRERGNLFDLQAAISQKTHKLTTIQERSEELVASSALADEDIRSTRESHLGVKVSLDRKRLELDDARREEAELEKETGSLSDALGERRETMRELERSLKSLREERYEKSSRLKSLKELEENLEGYGEGVRALIGTSKDGGLEGIRGIAAEFIQTDRQYEKAVEAALGDRLQGVVVDGHENARAAIEFLRTRDKGRGTLVPVGARHSGDFSAEVAGDGVIGPARGLVRARDGYEKVFDALLSSVYIVRDLDTALRLWESGAKGTFATLDGDLIEPDGVISSGAGGTGHGILSKKREIRELSVDVERLDKEVGLADTRLLEATKEAEGFEVRLAEISDTLGKLRLGRVAIEKDASQLSAELDRIGAKLESLGQQARQRETEERELTEAGSALRAEVEEAARLREDKEGALYDLQQELNVVKAELEDDRAELTEKKMELSALIEKHETSARDLKRADHQKEDLERRISDLNREFETMAAKRAELTGQRREAELKISELTKEILKRKDSVPALQDDYNTRASQIAQLEGSVRAARVSAEECSSKLSSYELERAELRMRLEHLEESVMHNYHITMEEIPEDIKLLELETEQAEEQVDDLREKIERIGPVNVGAIEEYNELSERFEFLSSQKEDLESSVRRLKEAIGKINKTSEELFMEAFEAVNEKFKEVFMTLFEGGRAELRLVIPDSGDIFESGLDIVAQPPGKKLQSLNLFSGGEKALIAVALVFSCFLVKPSPFCVLDEVDAPLDESNVNRFGNMIRLFSNKTQFIVITHSRPTMELADALYGVTMNEPGVSSMVSVRLKEAVEMAEA